ncbi:hypothetical protein KTO58_14730 [Chitinophaga pendula]|uniref:hypothetical protein n=1 Tax=Chitinophaga TaxID=79328 RepID=UPI0012FDD43D|nr:MULTISPECIES: hypothetical protein [Chitinophaga]UCJ04956.1 hypothetical protein KTO58_14730 [Chitinophaga pendula]
MKKQHLLPYANTLSRSHMKTINGGGSANTKRLCNSTCIVGIPRSCGSPECTCRSVNGFNGVCIIL